MTTVAWDGKTLAADTQMTVQGACFENRTKLYSLGNGRYAGFAGEAQDWALVRDWFSAGEPKDAKPALSPDFACIVVSGGGAYCLDDKLAALPLEPGANLAIGSGWRWAAAAMDFGRCAEDAVRYAITRDIYTGGDVDLVEVIGHGPQG